MRVLGVDLLFDFCDKRKRLEDSGLFSLQKVIHLIERVFLEANKKVQQFTFSSDKTINMRHDYNQFVVTAFICRGPDPSAVVS